MTEPLSESDNEISLLDIAAALAQFWILLLAVPLIVGALVFVGLSLFQGDRYESSAILQISANEAALLQSSRVVEPALRETGWLQRFDGHMTEARNALSRLMSVEKIEDVDFYRVSIVDGAPEVATRVLDRLIAELIVNSAPRGNEKQALEYKLQTLERAEARLNTSFDRVNMVYENATEGGSGSSGGTFVLMSEIGQSFVSLINDISTTEQQIFSTRMALEGSVSESDIIQAPTQADSPEDKRTGLIALLSAMAAGFVTLVGVLIYSGLRNASRNPEDSEKLQQIRSAFRFRRTAAP